MCGMAIERRECPVDNCNVYWDREVGMDAELSQGTWKHGDTISAYAARVALEQAVTTEADLRAHLETHDIVDFVRTIARLQRITEAQPDNQTASRQRSMNAVLRALALFDAVEDDEKLRHGMAFVREMEEEFGPVTDEGRAEIRRIWPR